MGREIRRVAPNWKHPRQRCEHSPWSGGCDDAKENGGQCHRPLYDKDFETAAAEWKKDFAEWESGKRPDYCSDENKDMQYWEWAGMPPDREYYRPKWSEQEATWYQVYETVSEGTPVSPAFATQQELIDYLCANGDYWCQQRGDRPPSRESVEAFVRDEFVPSMTMQDGVIKMGIDAAA